MGAMSRRKGHDFERMVARLFREIMPGADIRRGQQSHGACEPDVCTPTWWVECKKGRRTNIKAAMSQAIRDCDDRVPIAVTMDDRSTALVTMLLSDFLEIAASVWREKIDG